MANAYKQLMKLNQQERMTVDEDAMVVIEKRLQEIKQMSKPEKRDKKHVLDQYAPEVRELILKYKDMPMSELRKIRKRKGPRLLLKFRRIVGLVQLLLRGFQDTKKYHMKPEVSQFRLKVDNATDQNRTMPSGRSSINHDLQRALSTRPQYRTRKQIKQIMWVLRATKAFKHLFPAEMEEQVARLVAYEKYDDGRTICYQSRTPDRFYYIMSGRVNMMRQYSLSTGQITKSMGFLVKGKTTDPQEVDMQWMREDSLVAKGQVEVLLFDKQSFRYLQHTTDGPPLEFLRALHLFLEYPVERFQDHPDAIEMKYYGQGKIIVKDSNRTPWLHVVKSGLVKVVRRQSVIDARLSNESKFMSPTIEHLGCGKSLSHADAMLGIHAKQRKLKAIKNGLVLPQINTDLATSPFVGSLGIENPVVYRHNGVRSGSVTPDYVIEEEEDEDVAQSLDLTSKHTNGTGTASPTKSSNLGARTESSGYHPHSLWLTREKTGNTSLFPQINNSKNEVYHRRAYIQLDMLKTGDVFGLDHMQQTMASEPVGVSLLSDGAEVIKISKRFFLQNAGNNTMLKVETLYKEYMSEDEAKQLLYKRETWDQYKAALWERMTAAPAIASAADR